jgi:hypothetical protein
MAKENDETISQIHYHNSAAQKALNEAKKHMKASCRLQCKALEEHGPSNGVSDEVIAMSVAPKRED